MDRRSHYGERAGSEVSHLADRHGPSAYNAYEHESQSLNALINTTPSYLAVFSLDPSTVDCLSSRDVHCILYMDGTFRGSLRSITCRCHNLQAHDDAGGMCSDAVTQAERPADRERLQNLS
jgi:hypothetical protein